MFRMAVGHSDDIDLDAALGEIFAQVDEGLAGATPRGGLLFAAWDLDHGAILGAVRERYPGVELCGTTSAGEMSSILGFQEDSVALALFAADGVDITAGLGADAAGDPVAAARAAVAMARRATDLPPRLCVAIMPAMLAADPTTVLGHLRDELGPGVPVIGGGAAARDPRTVDTTSYQFVGDRITDGGVAILLFSGALAFSIGVDTGWRPLGPRALVTGSDGGRLVTIDARPALEFYERYLGPGDPPQGNPLAVFEGDSERFYLRAPISHDRATGTIGFFGTVPEGATIQLTTAATEDVFAGAQAALDDARSSFPSGGEAQAGLIFSCAIRKYILGTRTGREIELARRALGNDLPLAGFYCFGEIAPLAGREVSSFHNETMVAVLLGEA